MTDEELAAIQDRWHWNSIDLLPDASQAKMDIRALYDEVKWLRNFKQEAMPILHIVSNAQRLNKYKSSAWSQAGDLLRLCQIHQEMEGPEETTQP